MIVQFSFSNFKSFKDKTALCFVAPKGTQKYYTHSYRRGNNIFKVAAVYGANASGKSKLFEAFKFMRSVVVPPKKGGKIPMLDYWQTKYDAFKLNTYSVEDNSFFEVVAIIEKTQYRYGFELNNSEFVSEWLFVEGDVKENVFMRDNQKISYNSKYISPAIADSIINANMVSPDASFLVILQTFNDSLAKKVVKWFEDVKVISANNIGASMPISALTQNDPKRSIVAFLKSFDINIEDITPHEMNVDEIPEKIKAMIGEDELKGNVYDGIRAAHKRYNKRYERVDDIWFSLEKDESYGTNRLLSLSWPIIKSLKEGYVIFIDEFDSGIHPIIARFIIELFYREEFSSQLIINTQNTSLLNSKTSNNKKLFGKDQIFLVYKNRYGESSLTSLSEYGLNLHDNLEKLYMEGDFGAIPFIVMDRMNDILQNK